MSHSESIGRHQNKPLVFFPPGASGMGQIGEGLVVLTGLLLLSLAALWPLPLHLGDAVEDRLDALLNVWIMAWGGHQFFSDPVHLFDANIFYPYARTLAFSELLLSNALLSWPATALSGNPVLGYNLVLVLTFVLSGFGLYLLVRRLTQSAWGGLAAGIVFAFSAYRLSNLAQVQLLSLHWLPLALYFLDRLLRRQGDEAGSVRGDPRNQPQKDTELHGKSREVRGSPAGADRQPARRPAQVDPRNQPQKDTEFHGRQRKARGSSVCRSRLPGLPGASADFVDLALGLAAGACLALQALASFYYGLFSFLVVALYLAWSLIVGLVGRVSQPDAPVAAMESRPTSTKRGRWIGLAAGLFLAGLILWPAVQPYFAVEREMGFRRALADSEPFSASLKQWLTALPMNWLYGPALAPTQPVVIGGYPLDALFPGMITLILAGWGLWAGRRQWRTLGFYGLLAGIAFILSLGPRLYLAPGVPAGWDVPLPYAALYQWLPGFAALRAPVRFAGLVSLGLAVLVGTGVASLTADVSRIPSVVFRLPSSPLRLALPAIGYLRPATGYLLPLVCSLFLFAETWSFPVAKVVPVPTGSAVPPVYRWLAAQPPTVIVELPLILSTPEWGLLPQYYSIYHWQRTPDGYSGFIPPKHGEMAYEMKFFPSERSVAMLQGLGIEYVVVHTDRLADWSQRRQRLSAWAETISLAATFEQTEVYRVRRRSLLAAPVSRLFTPAAAAGQPYTAYLLIRSSGPDALVTPPNRPLNLTVSWLSPAGGPAPRQESVKVGLPIVISETAVVALPLIAPAEPGRYDLVVTGNDPAWGTGLVTATVVVDREADSDAPIPVRLMGVDLEKKEYRPGEIVRLGVRWRALAKIDAYYSLFVAVCDAAGQSLVQWDGQPQQGKKPTLLWTPGEVIPDQFELLLPAGTPPGRYTIEAGFYRAADLAGRLTLNEAGEPVERLVLAEIEVHD